MAKLKVKIDSSDFEKKVELMAKDINELVKSTIDVYLKEHMDSFKKSIRLMAVDDGEV